MFKLIEKLHNKPKNYRRKVALFFSIGFTFVVVLFWLVAIFNTPSPLISQKEQSETTSPFSAVGSSISSGLESVKSLLKSEDSGS